MVERLAAPQHDGADRIITHQVGSTHRRKLYETVGLDLAKDFSTFETLGNTGSAALLGIGSGLNCLMLAVEW